MLCDKGIGSLLSGLACSRIEGDCPVRNQRTYRWSSAMAAGAFGTIDYNGIAKEADAAALPREMVLGYVLAHGIGHLFLPARYHCLTGISRCDEEHTEMERDILGPH